jgi:hypothetical protein
MDPSGLTQESKQTAHAGAVDMSQGTNNHFRCMYTFKQSVHTKTPKRWPRLLPTLGQAEPASPSPQPS